MKYKLPEGFEIQFADGDLFRIYDKVNNIVSLNLSKLNDIKSTIEHYLKLSENIKAVNIPKNYKVTIDCIGNSTLVLSRDGEFLKRGKLKELLRIANETTDLSSKIKALNEGKEVELHQ